MTAGVGAAIGVSDAIKLEYFFHNFNLLFSNTGAFAIFPILDWMRNNFQL
jgi:hypothetical protein